MRQKIAGKNILVLVKSSECPLLEHRDEWTCLVAKTMTRTSMIVVLSQFTDVALIFVQIDAFSSFLWCVK